MPPSRQDGDHRPWRFYPLRSRALQQGAAAGRRGEAGCSPRFLDSRIESCCIEIIWEIEQADLAHKQELAKNWGDQNFKTLRKAIEALPGARTGRIWPRSRSSGRGGTRPATASGCGLTRSVHLSFGIRSFWSRQIGSVPNTSTGPLR
jgi:hypothetical protein